MADDQTKRRRDAWELGLQGQYDAAIDVLGTLLKRHPSDIVSLRMKGNLLELKTMDRLEHSAKKLTSSSDYLEARRCYEKILEIDSQNVPARIDLGDHYRNLEANDKALECYREAMAALQQEPHGFAWKEDVRELLERVVPLTKLKRHAREASLLEAWCRQALSVAD